LVTHPAERNTYRGSGQHSRGRIPLATQFSEDFYAKLGHGIAEELVSWMNDVDTTYRTDLERLNELNFARFEAKLDQRIAELRSEFQREISRLEGKLDRGLEAVAQQQQTALAEFRADLIKWMFLFWVGTLGTLIALLKFWV
jgi:Tfp pilus assembly protein PilP